MDTYLHARHEARRDAFQQFADQTIAPGAAAWDRTEQLPAAIVQGLARQGYLGAILPADWGGLALDMVSYGLLHEAIGRACSSTRSLMTVHDMVAQALLRCGNAAQRREWLPRLAAGERLAAFAVSEPDAGSDVRAIATVAEPHGAGYRLTGTKCWITGGQLADVYLLLARVHDKPTAFLVDRRLPGLSVIPITGMLGLRAAMLAELRLESCEVSPDSLVGRPGFGVESVMQTALDLGRYTVAWGCVGIGQACVEASLDYAEHRQQFGVPLRDHQLVRQMLTDMVVEVKASRLLCLSAGQHRDTTDASSINDTLIAKYAASRAAMRAATDTVQLHGARGCSGEYPAQRYLRDAKVMEIIEGSTQIQQVLIAQAAYQERARQQYMRWREHDTTAPRSALVER